jgi:putative ABC transport system substrate-binding protein
MKRSKLFSLCVLLISLVISPSFAQDDLPLVGIIKIGTAVGAINLTEQGILDVFDAYGYKNGRNIQFRQVNAADDVNLLPSLVELLMAENVDIIIPIQAATISATMAVVSELENPPAVIFSVVQDPYALGFAEDACTKPDYFTGQSSGANNIVLRTLLTNIKTLDPELGSLALAYNGNDQGASLIAELVTSLSEEYEIDILAQAVTSNEEVLPVIETLLVAGAEGILVVDVTVGAFLPDLSELSIQAQVPIFTIDSRSVYVGGTMGVGTNFYQLGVNTGRIAVAYLEGTVDLATTGISEEISLLSAVNLDVATGQGLFIPDDFVESTSFYIEAGESTEQEAALPEQSQDEMRSADADFIASLQCPREAEATEEAQ